ncbi:hypothetical protein PM082_014625 [Marasmius tenuissimus]|nr:hypothetical protein PM082_014625 [Marasmius tenuissimus]
MQCLSRLPLPPTSDPATGLTAAKRKGFEDAISSETEKSKWPRVRKSVKCPSEEKSQKEQLYTSAKYFKCMVEPFETIYTVVVEGMKADGREKWAGLISHLPNSIPVDEVQPNGAQPEVVQPEAGTSGTSADDNADEVDSDLDPDPEYDDTKARADFEEQCTKSWKALTKAHPVVLEFVNYCAEKDNLEGLLTMLNLLTEKANAMLYNDNKKLKDKVFDLIEPPFYGVAHDDEDANQKVLGIAHPTLLELFLDWKDIPKYRDGDEDHQAKVNEQYRSVTKPKVFKASGFPAFLYNIQLVKSTHMKYGFLLSPCLANFRRFVLLSEHGSNNDKKSTKATNADIMEVTSITIQFIAYIACLMRHTLSPAKQWSKKDKRFVYSDFFYLIIDIYDNMLPEFQHRIMAFWNKSIFGNSKGRVKKSHRSGEAFADPKVVAFLKELKADRDATAKAQEERAAAAAAKAQQERDAAAAKAQDGAVGDASEGPAG